MKFSTRQLVLLAVFGSLWGAVEISLGSVLKAMQIPLSGAVLAGIGLAVALTGRLFVPRRGSVLFMGVIAMILKLFSIGNIIVGPMIGILAEALLAEGVLSLLGKPSRLVFLLAGAAGVIWTFAQPLVTGPVLYGRNIVTVWLELIEKGSRLVGLDPSAALWVALALVGLHALIGGAAGWLAWDAGRLLQARVGGQASVTARADLP